MKAARGWLVLGALALSGCGDPVLWSRWQAESALGHARALERRVLSRERTATDAEFDRVEAALAAVVARWPAAEWADRGRAGGPERDVAIASGNAAYEVGVVRAARGRQAEAAEQYARIERDYAPFPAIVARARLARAGLLDRLGRFDESLAEYGALAAMDPGAVAEGDGPLPQVLAAPLELASRLRAAGRAAEADSMLDAAAAHFSLRLRSTQGRPLVVLADGISRVYASRGDAPGALAALRTAMRADAPSYTALYARALAARAFDAGAPESVFAYTRWAASLSGSRGVAGPAWLVAGEAWEQLGNADSALASYDAVLRQWTDPGAVGPMARYRQSRLLENLGEWERARAGFVALAARYPTHTLAFASLRHVVQHHLRAGEPEMARVVGEAAIQNLANLIGTNLDPTVQRDARAVRADLLLSLGRLDEAESVLLDLWRRFPEDSLAEDAGLRAARLAEHRAGGAARAESILAGLRLRAANAAVRRAAAAPSGS